MKALGGFGAFQNPALSNMRNSHGYQFAKSGVNSRSALQFRNEAKQQQITPNPTSTTTAGVSPPIQASKDGQLASARRETGATKPARALFDKPKTSVQPSLQHSDQNTARRMGKAHSSERIITFKNKLKGIQSEKKTANPGRDKERDEQQHTGRFEDAKSQHTRYFSSFSDAKPAAELRGGGAEKRFGARQPPRDGHGAQGPPQVDDYRDLPSPDELGKVGGRLQVIPSSRIVRRDSSVGSAALRDKDATQNVDAAAKALREARNTNYLSNTRQEQQFASNKRLHAPHHESKEQAKKAQPSAGKEVVLMQPAAQEHQDAINTAQGKHSLARCFTKIIAQTDRVQFQWSHPRTSAKDTQQSQDTTSTALTSSNMDLQYILEYGCGVKFRGVEQFRKIYQGKAHKCIVADLMPNTTYRFRVRPIRIALVDGAPPTDPKDVVGRGDWSEVIGVTTLSK